MNVLINAGNVKYRLTTKHHGFDLHVIKKVAEKKDGKETGDMVDSESWKGFHPNLQKVADKLFHCELERSDAATLEEMLTVMAATRRLIKTAGWTGEE